MEATFQAERKATDSGGAPIQQSTKAGKQLPRQHRTQRRGRKREQTARLKSENSPTRHA